jgi:hypothetical protein
VVQSNVGAVAQSGLGGNNWQIMGRIQSLLKRPPTYRLFDSNCEHFVSEVLGEKKESRQINGLAFLGLVFVGLAALR